MTLSLFAPRPTEPVLVDTDTDAAAERAPLVIGLFVEAQISGRELEGVVTLPKAALFKRDHIFTVDADNRIQTKRVTLLHTDASSAWVRGDLVAGEQIVIGQQGLLTEGVVVVPQPISELVAGG